MHPLLAASDIVVPTAVVIGVFAHYLRGVYMWWENEQNSK